MTNKVQNIVSKKVYNSIASNIQKINLILSSSNSYQSNEEEIQKYVGKIQRKMTESLEAGEINEEQIVEVMKSLTVEFSKQKDMTTMNEANNVTQEEVTTTIASQNIINTETSTSLSHEQDLNDYGEDIIIVNPLASPPTECKSQK